MEVRTGYKHTDVGLLPVDWGIKRLQSLTTQRATYGVVKAGAFEQRGIPMLRGGDIKGGRVNLDLPLISAEKSAEYQRTVLRDGDVVIALVGYPGEAAVVPEALSGANISRAVGLIRLGSALTPQFLTCYLNSPSGRSEFLKPGAGSAQMVVNLRDLNQLLVPLPPTKAEQQAISEVLGDADAIIDSLEQLLAKKRQIKQGAMQRLLTGKMRLPGFTGEWRTKRLGDTATLKARIGWQGLTTDEYRDSGDYYLVTGTEFKDGRVDWNTCHYVSESRYKQDKHIQLKERDVLVTKDGTIGKVALVTKLVRPATLNSGVFVIRPIDDAFYPEFFYYLLSSSVFVEFLVQLSAGSTISHLYQKDFVGFVYRTPPTVEEQAAIATLLSDMDAEIEVQERTLTKARQLKQGMMQELLTGAIRLV